MLNWAIRSLSTNWKPYSRVFLIPDNSKWVLAEEMRKLSQVARKMGVKTIDPKYLKVINNQVAFYASHFHLLLREKSLPDHRLGISYYHGLPSTGFPLFDKAYNRFHEIHPQLTRVHVSHSQMRDFLLNEGVAPEKVFQILIGVDTTIFKRQTTENKKNARDTLGIPHSAVVIGSFQRDGVGWNEGDRPRLEKGPDILLKTLALIQPRIPELLVLLSGYARGYVIRGLEELGIPYRHFLVDKYHDMSRLYHALDLYIVSSRQEGGPNAVFEAQASGVPLLTTRVGQAMDIIQHEQNGWIVDVEDYQALAYWTEEILNRQDKSAIIKSGIDTASLYTYEAQAAKWQEFFRGFVEES